MEVFTYVMLGIAAFIMGYALYRIFDLTALEIDRLNDRVDDLQESYYKFLKDFRNIVTGEQARRKAEGESGVFNQVKSTYSFYNGGKPMDPNDKETILSNLHVMEDSCEQLRKYLHKIEEEELKKEDPKEDA